MRRTILSAFAWISVLLLFSGVCSLSPAFSHVLGVNGIGYSVLAIMLAFTLIALARRLGWDGGADLRLAEHLFHRLKAALRNRKPFNTRDALPASEKKVFRLIRPSIRVHRYLLTISLVCLLCAIMLQITEYVGGVPMFGRSVLDVIAYIFLFLAAIPYLINILLSGYFFLRSVFLFLRGKR